MADSHVHRATDRISTPNSKGTGMHIFLTAWTALSRLRSRWVDDGRRRLAGQAGEGVISTAIAVLIMALIGAAMWAVFQTVFNDAGERIQDNVEEIQ